MPFDFSKWKAQLSAQLPGWRARMQAGGVNSVYYFIAASAFLPIAQAFQAGNLEPFAYTAFASGLGANLLANIVQNWRNEANAAVKLQEAAVQDTELPQKLDALFTQLDALSLAEQHLSTEDRTWFADTIQQELAYLKSGITYTTSLTGDGAIVLGNDSIALGAGAKYVGGNHTENYFTVPDPRELEKEKNGSTRRTYLEKLRRHCQSIPLAALGGEVGLENEFTLDNVYTELDTNLRIKTTDLTDLRSGKKQRLQQIVRDEETSEFQLPNQKKEDVVFIPALDAIRVTPRAVLLGDPGAGKSTFARRILGLQADTLLEPKSSFPGFDADLLPILIVLRELAIPLGKIFLKNLSADAQKAKLLQVIHQHLGEPLLSTALESGRVLLVLDGLDEVPQDLRITVRQAVSALLTEYNIKRLLITCRIRSYFGSAIFENLPTFTLRPFDKDKISQFARAWYATQTFLGRVREKDCDNRTKDLTQAATSKDLREIASNPMMLTSMAIIHQKEIGLPKERVRLYKLVVDVLLRRWQKDKLGEDQLTPTPDLLTFLKDEDRLLGTMERLAYEAHRTGKGEKSAADLPRLTALGILEQKEYLGAIGTAHDFLNYVDQRAGLMKGNGGELEQPTSYSFPHRIFQEYLTGCYLIRDRSAAREYYRHAPEGDFWALAAQLGAEELYYNRRGQPFMRDLAYELLPGEQPVTLTDQRAALWSGMIACISGRDEIENDKTSPRGGKAYLGQIRLALLNVLQGSLAALERAEAGRVLAKLGDPRPEVLTCEHMAFCHVPAGSFLYGDEKKKVNLPNEFWMGKYPVTNAQYRQFVMAGGYAEARFWAEAIKEEYWQAGKFKGRYDDEFRADVVDYGEPYTLPNHPVVGISWYEAQAFTRWLAEQITEFSLQWTLIDTKQENFFREQLKTGKLQVRLPSEQQWEKAARGTDGRIYPWGDAADPNRANYDQAGINTTSAVGCFPDGKSPYGAMEMSGNVWEWTEPDEHGSFYMRGGAFSYNRDLARCAYRLRLDPYNWFDDFGFRVGLSPVLLS